MLRTTRCAALVLFIAALFRPVSCLGLQPGVGMQSFGMNRYGTGPAAQPFPAIGGQGGMQQQFGRPNQQACQEQDTAPTKLYEGIYAKNPKQAITFNPSEVIKCVKQKKQVENKLKRDFKKAVNEVMKKKGIKNASKCPPYFDKKAILCYAKNADRKYKNSPKWNLRVIDNVAQIWKGKTLAYQVIIERLQFLSESLAKMFERCLSSFPSSSISVKQNSRGEVLSFSGMLNKRKRRKALECCERKKKRRKTKCIDGDEIPCQQSCGLLDQLFTPAYGSNEDGNSGGEFEVY